MKESMEFSFSRQSLIDELTEKFITLGNVHETMADYTAGRDPSKVAEREVYFQKGPIILGMRGFSAKVEIMKSHNDVMAILRKTHLFIVALLEYNGYFSLGNYKDDLCLAEAEFSLYIQPEINYEQRAQMFEELICGELKDVFETVTKNIQNVVDRLLKITFVICKKESYKIDIKRKAKRLVQIKKRSRSKKTLLKTIKNKTRTMKIKRRSAYDKKYGHKS